MPPLLEHHANTVEVVRRDLVELLRTAHVAAVCDDPSVFTDHVDWMTRVHPATGLPHAAVPASIRILRELSAPLGDRTRAILAEAPRDETRQDETRPDETRQRGNPRDETRRDDALTGADAGSPR